MVSPLSAVVADDEGALAVEAEIVCRGSRAFLEVRLTNPSQSAVRAALSTPFGSRPVVTMQPGATAERTIPTRGTEASSGTVSVTVDNAVSTVPYEGGSCG